MIATGITIAPCDAARLTVRTVAERLPGRRVRSGGKSPGSKLLRPVDPRSKRGQVLHRLLSDQDAERVASHFHMTREAIFTTLSTLHREHAIGYAASGGAITVLFPKGVTPEGGLWL